MRLKIIVLFVIICGGTYALTKSLSIAAGVAILLYVADSLLAVWADRKNREYFYGGKATTDKSADEAEDSNNKDNNGETDRTV